MPGWVFERKLDGVRMIATRERGQSTRLWSRNQKPMDASYPEIVDALDEHGPASFVLDGEIIAADGTHIRAPAGADAPPGPEPGTAHRGGGRGCTCSTCSCSTTSTSRGSRCRPGSRILAAAVDLQAPAVPRPRPRGRPVLPATEACAGGWEGLIAKRSEAPYVGRRSRDWLKLKCVREQEFVIGGWTDPQGSPHRVRGAAGRYHYAGTAELRYAGKVGTGYDDRDADDAARPLDQLDDKSPPSPSRSGRRAPTGCGRTGGAVGFSEWTTDGKLRHPRYLGLRIDKAPAEVVREQ